MSGQLQAMATLPLRKKGRRNTHWTRGWIGPWTVQGA